MPRKCHALVTRQWDICSRETDLLAFWTILQVSVEWNLFVLQHLPCKVSWPVSVFLCIGGAGVRIYLPAGLTVCWGEALRRECPEVPSRKSCQSYAGTWTPREFRCLLPVRSCEALGIYASPFHSKIWLNALWQCSLSFGSMWSCSSPIVELQQWDSTAHPVPQLGFPGLKTEPKHF